MKKIILSVSLLVMAMASQAQIKNPVKWTFSSKKITDKTYELHITASIEPGWHIYTIDHNADIGIATSVTLNQNPLGTATGKIKANGKAITMNDPSTGDKVKFYEKSVDLVQLITLKAPVKTNYTGTVEFMSCDDKQCLPPASKQFSIALQ
jgi:DsbC/DsbD-like thiol-disulfide interchange protein